MGIWDKYREHGGTTEWAQYEIENIVLYQVENMLDDYYWEYVAPLEKQIKELGGKMPTKSVDELISFRPDRNHEFWIEQKWEQFFRLLYNELLHSGFLTQPKKTESQLENKENQLLVSFLGCFDGVSGPIETYRLKWQSNKRGDLELCVYLIDQLIKLKIITDYKKDFMIENIFGIKDPTRKRQKFSTYSSTNYMPKRHKEIDTIIETLIEKLE
ncbi:MAG: hypothetical protein NWS46_01585 [Cyclobacteriaceae bacterium]|nr:hypothetical protein [Cyclobacteriaceae bacterium]